MSPRRWLTEKIFRVARRALPAMSDTERAAIDAGDVWWDAELFTGNPDWAMLLATPPARLSEAERAFLDGPTEELCAMLDEWRVNFELRDLSPEVWEFIKRERFVGMIIPTEYGGLGFSAFAHSEVVRKISTRSLTAAVTVMVPNSLGPGELLHMFGTDEQKRHWLPRLADGRELPCFGLTSPEAGSDAAAMIDSGVVCHAQVEGERVLGIRLNWNKRYITLAPVATVLGLAFKLYDPEKLLGGEEDIGITVALVPTNLPGVTIGRRHWPAMQSFQNGPTQGKDVFVPMSNVIGGHEQVGKGWAMLMSALAAGRSISLPSQSAAAAAFAAHTTGAYARIREQFNIPIGRFEGVQERLARLAGTAYTLDAARRLTCAALDEGRKPAVISAIMKLHATERMRTAVDDAMDVHGGKGIIDGPKNYIGRVYRSVPVGITVEGANILTRSLIVFGQGAIRSHPYILSETEALAQPDPDKALAAFDAVLWKHVAHFTRNLGRALARNWSMGRIGPAPAAGAARRYYKQVSRYAAGFSLASDLAMLTLGGGLKFREILSARLGDILSELYLLSAVLKRWEDEGRQQADLPIVHWCMAEGFAVIETRFAQVIANFPNRPAAWLLRVVVLPLGRGRVGPCDRDIEAAATLLLSPSATRDRLTEGIYHGRDGDAVAVLDRAFALMHEVDPIRKRLRKAGVTDPERALEQGLIDAGEAARLAETALAVEQASAVDDFAPEELVSRASVPRDVASPASAT